MSSVKKEEVDEGSSIRCGKKSRFKPKRRQRRWRYAMELPCHSGDMEKLWTFVAAHVEDDGRKKACSLAVKAWQRVCGLEKKVPYRERTDKGILPSVMPSFRRRSGESKTRW
jgi:hypothetical protein